MKQEIKSTNAPAAIGPYSQAVDAGSFVFVSGQLPINPATGEMPETVAEQTKMSIANIQAVLEAAGLKLDNVVKTTVFMTDMATFGEMNEVYSKCFSAVFPARSAVAVRELPKGAKVEIEVIATR